MHQTIGKFSARRKEQQTFRVEVKTTNSNPASTGNLRKIVKDARTSLRIAHTHNLAGRLVINQHTRSFGLLTLSHALDDATV